MNSQYGQPIYSHPYPGYPQAYAAPLYHYPPPPVQPQPQQQPPPQQSDQAPPVSQPSHGGTPITPASAPPTGQLAGVSQAAGAQGDDSSDDGDQPNSAYNNVLWDRTMRYSDEGVGQLKRQWDREYAHKPMPPPPPAIYATREEGVSAAKKFAKEHGYKLTIGHSNRDKTGVVNRILLKCQFGGKVRNMHENTPELRQRQRFSRKTDCPMKMRLQKRRFGEEWVMCISRPQHNHASDEALAGLSVAEYPDLEATLHDWHLAELAKGETPHGNTLKSRALALFAEMPQYHGNDPPNLDRKWLDTYRQRYEMPGKPLKQSGPPQLLDWNDAEATAAATAASTSARPLRTRETSALNGVESAFEDSTMLRAVQAAVKEYMQRYDASHDWDHILRVMSLAKKILRAEQPSFEQRFNPQVVYLAALVHDLGDHKYAKPGENVDNQIAELLLEHGAAAELALKVQLIARNVSFSNEVKNPRIVRALLDTNPELAIVQDADRLDAIGAVGIGRTFAYGGAKAPERGLSDTVEHFRDKLERLESMMKTQTGRQLARQRTERLQLFRSWWDDEYAVEE